MLSCFLGVERSVGGRSWQSRPGDERTALALAQRLGVPDLVGRVLAARGVPVEAAESFLQPTLREHLPDPSQLLDMDRAADRIAAAIRSREEVCVFGDYDVDGATSSALLKRFFDAVGGRLRIYIPDRMREGYGPNGPALERLAADGVGLVVTVDCGTTAFAALAAGVAAGLDIVVVDHHQAEPQLPAGCLVVNPNRLDETSAHGTLAAVGLSFLLLVAVNRALRRAGHYADRPAPDLLRWLDMVALGTVCDVVALTGLNRVFVAQGLKVLAERGNLGLRALADVAGMDARPGTFHLGFVLGPRINAGGRVGQADLGARLLTATDEMEAIGIAQTLDRLNAERRAIESAVLAAAMTEAEGKQGAPLIVVAGRGWHEGVIGIVAGRLKDRFRRPTFVFALNDGVAKGSGRSVPGVDLGAAVTAARQAGLLLNGGGHAMAAGLTLAAERLAELEAFLAARIAPALATAVAADSLQLDGALAIGGATRQLYEVLERAGPYGAGHPEPRFALPSARIVRADVVGGEHVRVILSGPDGGRLKGIAFRAADSALGQALLRSGGRPMHLAGKLRADDWQGRNEVQLMIEDAAYAEAANAA
jgi:single-stranded-DNA-specific exonuclease